MTDPSRDTLGKVAVDAQAALEELATRSPAGHLHGFAVTWDDSKDRWTLELCDADFRLLRDVLQLQVVEQRIAVTAEKVKKLLDRRLADAPLPPPIPDLTDGEADAFTRAIEEC